MQCNKQTCLYLNKLTKFISYNWHRQSDRSFPSIALFKDGLDKAQLTGSEIMFKVFMLYICLIQTNSYQVLKEWGDPRYLTKKVKVDSSEFFRPTQKAHGRRGGQQEDHQHEEGEAEDTEC